MPPVTAARSHLGTVQLKVATGTATLPPAPAGAQPAGGAGGGGGASPPFAPPAQQPGAVLGCGVVPGGSALRSGLASGESARCRCTLQVRLLEPGPAAPLRSLPASCGCCRRRALLLLRRIRGDVSGLGEVALGLW